MVCLIVLGLDCPWQKNDTSGWTWGFSNSFGPWHPFFQWLLIWKPMTQVSWHGEQEWRGQGPHKFDPDLTVSEGLEHNWNTAGPEAAITFSDSVGLTHRPLRFIPHHSGHTIRTHCCLPTAAREEFKLLLWIWKWSLQGWTSRPQLRESCRAGHSNFPNTTHQLDYGIVSTRFCSTISQRIHSSTSFFPFLHLGSGLEGAGSVAARSGIV